VTLGHFGAVWEQKLVRNWYKPPDAVADVMKMKNHRHPRVQAMYPITPTLELWLKDKSKSKYSPSACDCGGATASQRYCLSVGLPDSIINRKVATQKAQQIELDMLSGNFDPTLQKYKPEDPLNGCQAGSETSSAYTDVFKQHWDEFVEDKGQRLESPFTIVGMYNPIPKKVRNFGRKIIGSPGGPRVRHVHAAECFSRHH
jgi:hypothetical protein